jgi:CDP-diacylglycerol--glycerol-3-phosphate 3-phosphatidyltransferase
MATAIRAGVEMLNNAGARRVVGVVIDPVARGLLKLHVPPDAVTVFGTVGACVGALVFFPQGKFVVGVLVIVAFIFSDLLDGTMARMSGTSGPWGNFLDATLDRVADGAVFGGLLLWTMYDHQSPWIVAAALTTLVAGQVISYAKARAEAVGATANTGIAERAERLIIALVAAFVAGFGVPFILQVALIVLAALSVVTVIQRMVIVRKQLWQRRA